VPLPSNRSSELARIAAEAAGSDTSLVRFTVTHGPTGRDPDPIRWADGQPQGTAGDPELWPSDFCHFSAAGLSMSASTWPSAKSAFNGPIQIDPPEPTCRWGSFSYSGLTVPNPGFLSGESTQPIEVLVTFGSTPWAPSYRDCLMNSLITQRLYALANERAGGLVQHLVTPAAPFLDHRMYERGDGSSERLRDAVGSCIRMAVGLDPNLPTARLGFEEGVAALAEEYGLGLKLDDRRFNRVRGEWFTIRRFDRERYRQERNRLFPYVPADLLPRKALIATVTGLPRPGGAAAVIAALRTKRIGVLAASVCVMRKIGFIQLVVPASDQDQPLPAWSGAWNEGLNILAQRCATFPRQSPDDGGDANAVTNFVFAISPIMRCYWPQSSRRTGASKTGRVPYPLWLRWEVPHRLIQTPRLLANIQAKLQPYMRRCEVAYALSRLVRGDVVRGRAKLIVVLEHCYRDQAEAQRVLADAAERAQEETLKQLGAGDVENGRTRLRISPRERWLADAGVSA
jgi:hypothetical protein